MAKKKKSKYYVRSDGLHVYNARINGKRKVFYGKTDREIDQKVLAYKEAEELGPTFKEVADAWQAEHESKVTYSSMQVYSAHIKALLELFGTRRIKDITLTELQVNLNNFAASHSKKSTDMYRMTAGMVFNYAVSKGIMQYSPVSALRNPRSAIAPKTREALTKEQEERVIAYEMERGESGSVTFGYFLMFTGCRKGEALALSYEDIDRERKVIRINKKLNFHSAAKPPLEDWTKSENGQRDIPLLPPLMERIPEGARGIIFPGRNGYMTDGEYRTYWQRYRTAAGLPEGITAHCFRHSFATICYEAGIDVRAAAAFFGDTAAVMEGIYTHLREEHKQEAAKQLERYTAGMTKGKGSDGGG